MRKMVGWAMAACLMVCLSVDTVMGDAGAETPTGTLEIHITGFDNDQGVAMIAVADSAKRFTSEGQPWKGVMGNIVNREVRISIPVPYGTYAIKVFHDENGNGELDTRIFGIPTERYGFSNNVRGKMGPPPFEAARFTVDTPSHPLSIQVK